MGESDESKNIILSGFSEFDNAEMSVVNKIVNTYSRKFFDSFGVQELKIMLKPVHKMKNNMKFEVKASVVKEGKIIFSELVDKNVYFALDKVLKKVEEQLD